jgi:hypothetical protein
MTTQPIEFHFIAELLPLIEGKEFDALVADIRGFGLREPIVTLDGAILDGRNRYSACLAAGVEPRFRDFDPNVDGNPLAFVISMNARRRHLDESRGDSKRRVSELSRRCILVRTYTGGHAIAIELDLMRPIAHRVAHRQREAAK